MDGDSLTLQEAAELLGKSTQTVRRLIKKGEVQAQQLQTPQGFQYVVSRASMAARFPRLKIMEASIVDSPRVTIQEPTPPSVASTPLPVTAVPEPTPVSVKKAEDPWASFLENDYFVLEPSPTPSAVDKESVTSRELLELVQLAHKEKLMLITILERLQAELERQQRRPKSFFQWIGGLWKGSKRDAEN